MVTQDFDWIYNAPTQEGLYLIWRGDVETLDNFRGAVQIRKRTDGVLYWTSTEPRTDGEPVMTGLVNDFPLSYKYARIAE